MARFNLSGLGKIHGYATMMDLLPDNIFLDMFDFLRII